MYSIKEFEYLRISLDTIKLATNDFSTSNYISQGGFGKVYKGDIVHSGQRVVSTAIKRLDRSFGQGTTEFWKEVRFLATYKHENLVSLLGYCDEDGENILVYEYAPNGSLSKLISGTSLSWEQRLNICIGSARGLEFLHNPQGTMQRVLHCDIKSSNILLDKHFNALLSDFGLSKFGPANQEYTFVVADATGTLGYIDPLYYKLGYLTKESDIYSFGVVLFEVLCGRLCIETKYDIKDERRLLPTLAHIRYEEKRLDTIIHDSLRDKINPQSLEIFSAIAYKCLKSAHTDRPTAAEIVSELELALKKELGDAAVPRDIKKKIYGRVVMRMSTDTTRFSHVQSASLNFLGVHDIFHKKITFQLIISADHPDDESSDGRRGKYGKLKYGKHAFLEEYNNSYPFDGREAKVEFEWNVDIGFPAAVLVTNPHNSEFYLESFTLENVPGHGQIHFVCSSWVYPSKCYSKDRIFFVNKAYLPHETPEALRSYREEELAILRGDGSEKLEEWDRVYNYDIYNDLGNPDKGQHYARPVLGGSTDYPYPRRGRTGRPFTRSDPKSESRVPHALSIDIYVPRDEKFGQRKLRNVVSHGLIAITQLPLNEHDGEFYKLHEVSEIYKEGLELPNVNSHGPPGGPFRVKFPIPDMIKGKSYDWHSDEEFARQMLAGVNPVSIRLLKNFPPTSKLDFRVFGYQNSSIRSFHIEESLDGLTIGEAVESNKLFILDHHDSLMPYLRKINETSTKVYATRTLLLLKKDGTLKPLAIELSLPHPDGDQLGAVGAVYTPAKYGLKSTIWQMAKAYAAVNDSGIHQLISHWLNTHAVIEPFVIATHRQLSVLHPMHKLLHPHFHHTMSINAFWRQMLINEGGFLEKTLFTGRYGMEMSSMIYKDWALTDQALPVDLVKRGMAIEDSNSPHGLHLVIEDYPYAVDGLEIWFAIKTWVEDYCSIYYKSDHMVENDTELQSWWTDIRTEGHGDKKHDPWWPKMHTCHDLVDTCTTIIWVASALHAAVNFGQYTYAGYISNHPSISCRFLPQPGSPDHDKQLMDPEGTMSKTFPFNREMLLGMSLAKLLSTHTSDEVYLGQREFHDWTADSAPLNAFKKFNKKLKEIERRIVYRNNDANLKNRIVPYNLLYPSSEVGLTGKGIPNSVSM